MRVLFSSRFSLLFWNMKWAFYCISCWLRKIGINIRKLLFHMYECHLQREIDASIELSTVLKLMLLMMHSQREIGYSFAGHLMEKIESENLLHRAFSVFLFNSKYELLLQVCGWLGCSVVYFLLFVNHMKICTNNFISRVVRNPNKSSINYIIV